MKIIEIEKLIEIYEGILQDAIGARNHSHETCVSLPAGTPKAIIKWHIRRLDRAENTVLAMLRTRDKLLESIGRVAEMEGK